MSTPGAEEEPQPEPTFLNISAYKFVKLDHLDELREELKGLCDSLELKGTILLSEEGINLFLAGLPEKVQSFVDNLRQREEFCDLQTKDSFSATQPFRRMLVRIKNEIIAFGIDGIDPEHKPSQKLTAQQLKQWLDEGRKIRLLDVRNDYEVELGTFHGAEQLGIGNFRDFPQAIENLPPEAKTEPIVMFCTGGIRCEKAGPMMEQAGFESVFQLDGGILKYFEECGGAHYDGACFVFDGRVALDPQLQPTGDLLCFACQAVLSPRDVASPTFLFGKYCPKCYVDPAEAKRKALACRQAQISAVAGSQPGSHPYTNVRQMYVPGKCDGRTLIEFLCDWHPPTSVEQWLEWLAQGQIQRVINRGEQHFEVRANQPVKAGQCYEQMIPNTVEPHINPQIQLLHEDSSIVVVNKPAPLPCHPSGRFNRNTLTSILSSVYQHEKLRLAHRLDSDTSGIVLLCRKHRSAKFVQPQFSTSDVSKRYIARVVGHPQWREKLCSERISEKPGVYGTRCITPDGLLSLTRFLVLGRMDDGTSLIEAIPETGRTHQIRLHLAHMGHSIVGDSLYGRGQADTPIAEGGEVRTLCLHAESLTLTHPDTRKAFTVSAPWPHWATAPIVAESV
ncbi:MAG: sulfurtransferase [Planctomycetales bacterium]|nr:sulfurtransferase [Planctomycetales bacterium]